MSKTRKLPAGRPAAETAGESVGEVLCSRVRELRNKKGWTLEEMSAACGGKPLDAQRDRAGPGEPHAGRGLPHRPGLRHVAGRTGRAAQRHATAST